VVSSEQEDVPDNEYEAQSAAATPDPVTPYVLILFGWFLLTLPRPGTLISGDMDSPDVDVDQLVQ